MVTPSIHDPLVNSHWPITKWGSVAKNSESMLKAFPQTQIPGECIDGFEKFVQVASF